MVGVPNVPDCADIIAYLALANANNTAVMVHTFYNGPACSRPCMRVPLSADPGVLVEWRYFVTSRRSSTATTSSRRMGQSPFRSAAGSVLNRADGFRDYHLA